MSKFAEQLTDPAAWAGLMMGNHALVRGMLEAGARVVTAYPGSPTPEIADAIQTIPEETRPLHFEWCTNEKVALEVAFGASINGHPATAFFKSVGLNVALDTAVQLSMMRCEGGLVIILGDDPGANSSQNEQDNRHLARLSYIPMFEPGTPTEAYGMYLDAMRLSQQLKMPVFLRLTTHVCHAREVIKFAPLPERTPDWTPRFTAHGQEYWPITAGVFPLKRSALHKLVEAGKLAEASRWTEVLSPNGSAPVGGQRLGVISHAIPAYSVLECLDLSGASVDLLKLGMTYPLPEEALLRFCQEHDEVFLLEELDRVLEPELKSLLFDAGVTTVKLHVRQDLEDLMYEFTPDRVWQQLSRLWPAAFPPRAELKPAPEAAAISPRLAQMCPGCGHRSAFHAIAELLHSEYPQAITVADIGCHSLGSMEPYNMGEVLLCMGHSNGTGAGLSIGNTTRPVITFIGDSTLFHAGIPAIINAIANKHNITLVVLENYTTAMTGHQPTMGSGELGNDKIDIPAFLTALGCKFVKSIDAYRQGDLQDIMREAIAFEGFSVVIANHPCMLKFLRERARKLAAKPVAAQ
jgi:indolepyruvate ferredoxin oxidoreductase, alpha subunit